MKNIWKSTQTGKVYEMPVDWLPQFGGWELVGTIQDDGTAVDTQKPDKQ